MESRAIKKAFGSNLVLRDVTLRAESGQVTGIIGPNGVGKTTALKILATLLTPSGGNIVYDGKEIVDKKDVRRRIGFVSHQPFLYLDLTPAEKIRSSKGKVYGEFHGHLLRCPWLQAFFHGLHDE